MTLYVAREQLGDGAAPHQGPGQGRALPGPQVSELVG